MDNKPSDVKRNTSLLYLEGDKSTTQATSGSGRISNALTRAISYDRNEELFNSLSESDKDRLRLPMPENKGNKDSEEIDRLSKPVVMTSEEFMLTLLLSDGISREIEQAVLQEAITSIREKKGRVSISRYISIERGSKSMYGGTRSRQKVDFINLFSTYARKTQLLMIGDNPKKLTPVISPLIRIDNIVMKEVDGITTTITDLEKFLKNATPEQKAEQIDGFNFTFGTAFYYNLDKQWAYISPKIYPTLKKNKTELYRTLLSVLLSNYITIRFNADKVEEKLRKEMNRRKKVSKEEYSKMVKEARRKALTYTINAESLKKKLQRDYSSSRTNKLRFWTDLKKAVEALIEIDIITGYEKIKGAQGQDKIIFYISDTYNYTDKGENPLESAPSNIDIGLLPF